MAGRTDYSHKVHENRLRRAAKRQELELQKIRRRDPRATDYDRYQIVDPQRGVTVTKLLTLEEAEDWLMWDLERGKGS